MTALVSSALPAVAHTDTLGLCINPREQRCCGCAGGIHVVLKIWDIGGQSLTGKMIPHHLQNAQVRTLLLGG